MGYGGDFGDDPNDGNFVMDGLCSSTHSPLPGLVEYKKAIEPVQTLAVDGDRVTVVNRYDFVSLQHLVCRWRVVDPRSNGKPRQVDIPEGTVFPPLPSPDPISSMT